MLELQQQAVANHQPRQRTDVTVHELDGEALVYDPASGDTHRLNDTALLIWRQCDGRRSAERIARRIAEVYDISEEKALEHVIQLISEFQKRLLVVATV